MSENGGGSEEKGWVIHRLTVWPLNTKVVYLNCSLSLNDRILIIKVQTQTEVFTQTHYSKASLLLSSEESFPLLSPLSSTLVFPSIVSPFITPSPCLLWPLGGSSHMSQRNVFCSVKIPTSVTASAS